MRALYLAACCAAACGSTAATAPGDGGSTHDGGGGTPDGGAGGACADNGCAPGLTCMALSAGAAKQCLPPPTAPMVAGGAPLAAMEIWTVVWAGDEAAGAALDHFRGTFLASDFYKNNLAEYGVGAGSAKGVIVVAGAPPALVDDQSTFFEDVVPTLIGKQTTDGTTVPPPNPNTIFGFLVPTQTNNTTGDYHDETETAVAAAGGGMLYVPYLVVQRDASAPVPVMEDLTWSDSHELVEAAADPHPFSDTGWATSWNAGQNEIADLCGDIPITAALPDGVTYTLTRLYSGVRAKARSGDPCVPALPGDYFNVAIVPGQVLVPAGVGKSVTVQLVPFSYGAAKAVHWSLFADDPSYQADPAQGTATPGQTIAVTITRTASTVPDISALNLWVTDPATPDAMIPLAEWIGAVGEAP